MKLEDVPYGVKVAIQGRMGGADNNRCVQEAEEFIAGATAAEVFNEYASWHGILGWGTALFDLAVKLHEAEKKEQVST